MTLNRFLSPSPRPGLPVWFNRGSTDQSLQVVGQCLATAEWELRTQFTRIAQLQSELDLRLTALQRATDAHAMSLSVECLRSNGGLERASGT